LQLHKKRTRTKKIDFVMSVISFYLKPDGNTIKMTTPKGFPLNNKIKNSVFLIGFQIYQDMRTIAMDFRIDEQHGCSYSNKIKFLGHFHGYVHIG
jgi:hypothetical protein